MMIFFSKRVGYLFLLAMFSMVILVIDVVTGPYIRLQVLFIVPVIVAVWFNEKNIGILLGIVLPLFRFIMSLLGNSPASFGEKAVSMLANSLVLVVTAYFFHKTLLSKRTLLMEIDIFEKLLPICCYCKKIQTKKNEWKSPEQFIADRSDTQFTHMICPQCREKLEPKIEEFEKSLL